MNQTALVLTIVATGLSIMVTFILGTLYIANRFGRVENRLTRIETKLDIDYDE